MVVDETFYVHRARADSGCSPNILKNGRSKESPNDERNKKIYINMLARQCLGEEICGAGGLQSLTSDAHAMVNNQLDSKECYDASELFLRDSLR